MSRFGIARSRRIGCVRALSAVAIAVAAATSAAAAQFTVENLDDPGEGFNDATPALPIAGTSGTTVGAQRLIAFGQAVALWGSVLESEVEIQIDARFDPLGGSALSATLGTAGPKTLHRDFVGRPIANTWYVAALANRFAGQDLAPNKHDVRARFNSDLDGATVLGPVGFYYGLDGQAGADIDFVTVALHELAHGLGFLPAFDLATGAKRACDPFPDDGCDDAYLLGLADESTTPPALSDMSDEQRAAAAKGEPSLLWVGPMVASASGHLTAGVRPGGEVEVHAPASLAVGSSVAHFSTTVEPAELMRPSYTAPTHELGLTLALLEDIGWNTVVTTTTTTTTVTTTTTSTTTTTLADPACGDANRDGDVTSTDALMALATAVGTNDCEAFLCDVDSSGAVTATDARRILRVAVGDPLELVCPTG